MASGMSDVKADSLYFIHQDHLGSTSLVTDPQGSVVSQQVYYPYGETRSVTSDVGYEMLEKQYTGQISDQDQTGLYYYNARYYNPQIAKFTQADNVNNQQNRYTYVGNNPITKTDPTGHVIDNPFCILTGNCGTPVFTYDYSNMGLGRLGNSIAMTVVELVATPVCWSTDYCHVDWGENVIVGATPNELVENSISSFGTVAMPGEGDDLINLLANASTMDEIKYIRRMALVSNLRKKYGLDDLRVLDDGGTVIPDATNSNYKNFLKERGWTLVENSPKFNNPDVSDAWGITNQNSQTLHLPGTIDDTNLSTLEHEAVHIQQGFSDPKTILRHEYEAYMASEYSEWGRKNSDDFGQLIGEAARRWKERYNKPR